MSKYDLSKSALEAIRKEAAGWDLLVIRRSEDTYELCEFTDTSVGLYGRSLGEFNADLGFAPSKEFNNYIAEIQKEDGETTNLFESSIQVIEAIIKGAV